MNSRLTQAIQQHHIPIKSSYTEVLPHILTMATTKNQQKVTNLARMHHRYKRYWELFRGQRTGHSRKTEDQASEKMSVATSSLWFGRVLRLGVQQMDTGLGILQVPRVFPFAPVSCLDTDAMPSCHFFPQCLLGTRSCSFRKPASTFFFYLCPCQFSSKGTFKSC